MTVNEIKDGKYLCQFFESSAISKSGHNETFANFYNLEEIEEL